MHGALRSAIIRSLAITFGVITLLSSPSAALALQIFDTNQPLRGDFVLEPAKVELESVPGQSQVVDLRITNRDKSTRTFTVSTEDTAGSQDPATPIVLLGDKKGPWTLRDYLNPETLTFTLKAGQQMILPVTVDVPADAEPGGRYASVIISNEALHGGAGGSNTVARLTALFFVRIPGAANTAGAVDRFLVSAAHGVFFDPSSIPFDLYFRNTGDVHLDPEGHIAISNIYGMNVGDIRINPFFVMPQSLRYRQVVWTHQFLIGRYSATLTLNRGFASSSDVRVVTFWVLPWQPIAILLVALGLLVTLVRLIVSRFEIRRRR